MYAWPFFPNDEQLSDLSARLNLLPHSYPEVGQSQQDFPAGYDHDRNKVYLGEGELAFEKAKEYSWFEIGKKYLQLYNKILNVPTDNPQ